MSDFDRAMRQAAMTAELWSSEAQEALKNIEGSSKWTDQAKATYIAGFMNAAGLDQLAVLNYEGRSGINQSIGQLADNVSDLNVE